MTIVVSKQIERSPETKNADDRDLAGYGARGQRHRTLVAIIIVYNERDTYLGDILSRKLDHTMNTRRLAARHSVCTKSSQKKKQGKLFNSEPVYFSSVQYFQTLNTQHNGTRVRNYHENTCLQKLTLRDSLLWSML